MKTYDNIIEALKDNRQQVINEYEKTNKEITLKAYMEEVIAYFNKHTGIARKICKGSYSTYTYIENACVGATQKANARLIRQNTRERMAAWADKMNAHGWLASEYGYKL